VLKVLQEYQTQDHKELKVQTQVMDLEEDKVPKEHQVLRDLRIRDSR
jgi:hypothetical protein